MYRTVKDLRLHFKRSTGIYTPMDIDDKSTQQATQNEYIRWLEDELIKCQNIKHKFLPWEDELQRGFKNR